MNQCFVKGTLLKCEDGLKPIETIWIGDRVASRSDADATGQLRYRSVQQVYTRTARVMELTVAGKVIGTTEQHPFHVKDRGWVAANELSPGDLITADQDGYWVPVEALKLTDRVEFVYKLRVATNHTYFVAYEDWNFGVWAHNTYGGADAPSGAFNAA